MSNQECRFAVPDSFAYTQRDNMLAQLRATTRKHTHLLTVIEALRRAEGEQLDEILRRIRSAGSVDDFLDMVGDASLLLPSVGTSSQRLDAVDDEASRDSLPAAGSNATQRSTQTQYRETPPPRPRRGQGD